MQNHTIEMKALEGFQVDHILASSSGGGSYKRLYLHVELRQAGSRPAYIVEWQTAEGEPGQVRTRSLKRAIKVYNETYA